MTLLVFLFISAVAIFMAVSIGRTVHERVSNEQAPMLTVPALIVGKRTDVGSASTWYYATFELESGARLELRVSGKDFGLLAEADVGDLTYQGRSFEGFRRRA